MESSPIAPTTGIQQSPYEFLESLSLWVHPEARLLICFDDNCKHAISPNGSHPTNHLRDKHKISLSRRKGLRKVLATLDLKNPDQAAPLADGSLEDKKLWSYDGFSCLHCKYRTINLTLIIQHYSQDLPNYPQHPRRFSRKADIETYFEYVYLQTWASGASRAYWIVERDGRLVWPAVPVGSIRGLVSSGQDRTGDEQQDLIDSVKAREYQRNRRLVDGPGLAGDTQTAAAGSTTTYAEQRPWLERTRWETTYKNRDRSLLRRLIQAPYLQLHGRPDAPPYLLASAARVPGLSALAFCFRAYRMDAKQRERFVGVRFNKKLDSFLNAIWHHEDLANSPLTALGAYPIEDATQAQQQAEEMGVMRIEYEDMDMDGSVYEDLAEQADLDNRRLQLMKSLRFEQIDSRKTTIKTAYSKTCSWFLKHRDYLEWLDLEKQSQHHGFLWIRGKPGAGKSIIMKFIYTKMKKTDIPMRALTISFFFNGRGELLEKSVLGMYRSLLLQLLEGFPDLQRILDDTGLISCNQVTCPPLNVLKDLFRSAVSSLEKRTLICFVDALDECDEQQVKDMVETFEKLAEQCVEKGVTFQVCFSSRHYPYIDIKSGIRLTLEGQDGHNEDLKRYISKHLRIQDPSLVDELTQMMLDKAAGVFFWVALVVDILNEENRHGRIALRSRLQEVPSELSQLFKDILTRDQEHMEDLLLSILWILLAERPLKPGEYYHALWSGLSLKGLVDLEIPPVNTSDASDCINKCIISSSKGLAEITKAKKPTVQFIHESVRDFLIKDKGLYQLWPELGADWESQAHERLKLCCNAYVFHRAIGKAIDGQQSNEAQSIKDDLLKQFPFLEYASQFVLGHANAAAYKITQQRFISEFPVSNWVRIFNTFEKHKVRKYSQGADILYILADRGHSELIRVRLDVNPRIDGGGGRYRHPLLAAMAKGNKDSVTALLGLSSRVYNGIDITDGLKCKLDSVRSNDTPLSWACEEGHVAIAAVLLDQGAQVGEDDLGKYVGSGDIEVVKMLLEKGVDARAADTDGWTPLHRASENGHWEIAKMLLEKGADARAANVDGLTPLHLASQNGHLEIAQLLLEKGVDAGAADTDGWTPLHLALQNGHLEIAKMLLEKGADPTAPDQSGSTPLQQASQNGHLELFQMLLVWGADDAPAIRTLSAAHREIQTLLAAPQTDSGYMSTSANVIHDKDSVDDYIDDTSTEYSTTSSMSFLEADTYIEKFARYLASHTSGLSADKETQARISTILPSLLEAFALQVGHQTHVPLNRTTMAFVHRYRREIAETFKNIQFNQDHERILKVSKPSTSDDTIDQRGFFDAWIERVESPPGDQENERINQASPEPTITEQSPEQEEVSVDSPLLIEESAILQTTAFKWLLSRLLKEFHLTPTKPYAMQSIGERILAALPPAQSISRKALSPTYSVSIELECKLFQFFERQKYPRHPHEVFDGVIALTGSCDDAQAATCGQYLSQTWPSTAPHIIELLKDCLMVKHGCPRTMSYPDGTTLKVRVDTSALIAEVNGMAATVAEIGEQLAWLGAAFRERPEKNGLVYCTPYIVILPNESPSSQFDSRPSHDVASRIQFYVETVEGNRNMNGQCWQSLFKSSIIVKGYPIPRRNEWNVGLEASLDIMAGLARTDQIHAFGDRFYIKGYSTMLVPTRRCSDIQYWHLIHQTDGGRLSHFANDTTEERCVGSLNDLEHFRHILGWCSKVEPFPGLLNSTRTLVTCSMLPKCEEDAALAGGVYKRERPIAKIFNYFPVTEDTAPSISSDDYVYRLRLLEAQFFLLWDEKEKRGWLINGATALLHAVEECVAPDINGDSRSALLFRGHGSEKAYKSYRPSAFQILNDRKYQNLPLYGQENSHTTVKDKIKELCSILEYFIDLQNHAKTNDRLRGKSRKYLEGWDFEDLVSNFRTFHARQTTLETLGKEWVDFIRAIKAVTLFGQGFGDIIRPHKTCRQWTTLPKGKYYIATLISDLHKVLKEHGHCGDGHLRLGDNLIWHSATPGSDFCKCNELGQDIVKKEQDAR
ncbi:Ankyrin repeat [Fusarium oxysporum f. sp. vasinfectum]|nr:Ankyrin repeat [Fusarium oxysporum f. sp. vasinfectum]